MKVAQTFLGLMALAGLSKAAQADMGTVIGIDLGTTYSW
jgi:molecular chaperone DnaK (HSP70)